MPRLALAIPILLALSASAGLSRVPRGAVPAARPIGKPVDCVQLSNIRNTRVHGDGIIDFHMKGGKVYRNTLPYSCPSLGFEEQFLYKTSISRLCSVDTITVLRTGGGSIQGPTCGLGRFQPVEIAKRRD